jgi:hypothetical protein
VRTRVGLTTDAAQLLDAGTLRDRWLVLGQEESEDTRLTTRRIWLRGAGTGKRALLLSYGGGGRAPELSLPVGREVDAELAYYPGAYPLRATLGERHAEPTAAAGPPPGTGLGEALAAYGSALAADPWLEGVPVVLADVVPIPRDAEGGWQLADASGTQALPVDPRGTGGGTGLWQLLAVSGGEPVLVFGELGHSGFRPVTTWSDGIAVPLSPGRPG